MSSMQRRVIAAALCVLSGAAAPATNIYRCKVDGVATFVDSPSRCPQSSSSVERLYEPKAPAATAPASPAFRSATPSRCQELAYEPTRFRECLRTERRVEVRRIATARLESFGRAVRAFIDSAAKTNSIIAVANKGRGPAWCEVVLSDVMAQENLDVVDDEAVGGPRWIQSGVETGRSAAEVLDPNFKEWRVPGGKVPDGYVTARLRGSSLVVLRVMAACTSGVDGAEHCNQQPYVSVFVYDDVTPIACNVSAVGRAYWPSWQSSMTPIFEAGARRMRR